MFETEQFVADCRAAFAADSTHKTIREVLARAVSEPAAVSLNVAATNGGTLVETLSPPDLSLSGRPIGSARLGFELNLPQFELKLGTSGEYGPRNDQRDSKVRQRLVGADLRIAVAGLYLSAEYVRVDEDEGGQKITSLGVFPIASAFHARGFYGQIAYGHGVAVGPLHKLTVYARYEQRHAWFGGFTPITVDRFTGGLRLDLWEAIILKAEYLDNRELSGAPTVANNVFTSSLVYSW